MLLAKIHDKLKKIPAFLFALSDKISSSAFYRMKSDWVIEIGVHKGEIPLYINGRVPYIGFEANPSNIAHFNLDKLNVYNYAIVPNDFKDKFIKFEIPCRDAKSNETISGKGSILKRNPEGWGKSIQLEVPALNISEINNLFKTPMVTKAGKIWVDAEGISVTLVREMFDLYNVSCCHFEYDFKLGQYLDDLDRDLGFLSERRFFKARTSHDQYNIFVFDKYNWSIVKDIISLKIIDIAINFMFTISRFIKKRNK